MADEIKYMDLNEFVKLGLLQEVNRRFFHPLGLAISMNLDRDTGDFVGFGEIWDYRDDLEGMFFKKGEIDRQKIENVEKLRVPKLYKRSLHDRFHCDLDGIQVK